MKTCPETGKTFLGKRVKEWQPGLNKRQKWFEKEIDFKIGDVVLVLSPESKREKWILQRISDVFPGKENHVRVAKFRIEDQEYIRSISKLPPLPHTHTHPPLSGKNLRRLINQSLSKIRRMIKRKYNNYERIT